MGSDHLLLVKQQKYKFICNEILQLKNLLSSARRRIYRKIAKIFFLNITFENVQF